MSARASQISMNDLCNILDTDTDNLPFIESDYYDLNQMSNWCTSDPLENPLCIMHLNIRSLNGKLDGLITLLNSLATHSVMVDVILLCETLLNDVRAAMCHIPGFSFITNHRCTSSGGGVGIYINNRLSFNRFPDFDGNEEGQFESIAAEIRIGTRRIVIAEVYCPPNTSEIVAIEKFTRFLGLFHNRRDVIIGTDQNFDLLKYSSHKNTSELLDTFTTQSFTCTYKDHSLICIPHRQYLCQKFT